VESVCGVIRCRRAGGVEVEGFTLNARAADGVQEADLLYEAAVFACRVGEVGLVVGVEGGGYGWRAFGRADKG